MTNGESASVLFLPFLTWLISFFHEKGSTFALKKKRNMTDSEHRHSAFLLIRELKRMGVYNKFIRNRENQRMQPLINSKNKIEKARLVDVATPLDYLCNFNCSAVSFCWFDSLEGARFWSEISQKLKSKYYKYDMLLARKKWWLGKIKKN